MEKLKGITINKEEPLDGLQKRTKQFDTALSRLYVIPEQLGRKDRPLYPDKTIDNPNNVFVRLQTDTDEINTLPPVERLEKKVALGQAAEQIVNKINTATIFTLEMHKKQLEEIIEAKSTLQRLENILAEVERLVAINRLPENDFLLAQKEVAAAQTHLDEVYSQTSQTRQKEQASTPPITPTPEIPSQTDEDISITTPVQLEPAEPSIGIGIPEEYKDAVETLMQIPEGKAAAIRISGKAYKQAQTKFQQAGLLIGRSVEIKYLQGKMFVGWSPIENKPGPQPPAVEQTTSKTSLVKEAKKRNWEKKEK